MQPAGTPQPLNLSLHLQLNKNLLFENLFKIACPALAGGFCFSSPGADPFGWRVLLKQVKIFLHGCRFLF